MKFGNCFCLGKKFKCLEVNSLKADINVIKTKLLQSRDQIQRNMFQIALNESNITYVVVSSYRLHYVHSPHNLILTMGLKYFYCDDNFTNFTLKMLRLTILLIAFPIIIDDLPFFILDVLMLTAAFSSQLFYQQNKVDRN